MRSHIFLWLSNNILQYDPISPIRVCQPFEKANNSIQFNSMTFQYGQKSQNFIEELDRLQMTKVTKLYWRTWSITKQLDRQFWTRVGSKTSIGVVFVSCPDKQILSTSLSPPPKLTAKLFSAICVLHPHSTLVDFICKSCKWDIFLWAVGIIY